MIRIIRKVSMSLAIIIHLLHECRHVCTVYIVAAPRAAAEEDPEAGLVE